MTVIDRKAWDSTLTWIDHKDADIDQYMATHPADFGFDLRAKLHDWRDTGIVIFEGAVDTKLLDQFAVDLEYLKNHHTQYELTVGYGDTTRPIEQYTREELESDNIRFTQAHTISEAACRLSLTKEVVQFLGYVFGSPACLEQSLTFIKGSQQPIHIDYAFVRAQTKLAHLAASWIPLEDVHPDSGPLAYYPGSHRDGVAGFFDWGGGSILLEPDSVRNGQEFADYLYARMDQAGIQPTIYLPKRGDVLIWHGGLAHAGTAIKQPGMTRKSYVTHYTSLNAYPTAHMEPHAIEIGACFHENGGYVFDFPWLTNPRKLPSWKRLG